MFRMRARRCVAALAAIPLATIVVAIVTSCRGDVTGLPAVTIVRVSGVPAEGVLIVGETLPLSASTTDASGQTRPDGQVAWSSSNPAVATVRARPRRWRFGRCRDHQGEQRRDVR